MNEFTYNPRSEVLTALLGTNGTEYVYDDIGNHSLYPANSLNQYLDSSIVYDADGNMTRCGNMTFGWDAENRLVSADAGATSITNAYDYKHRRVRKTVNGESHAFVYDGWNLIAETINDTDTRHYFWGLDMSDSLQGAGGVGGLLAVSQGGSMYYPVYDNNGNVTAYLDDSGNIVASYEYNAFGETLSQSGNKANDFAFRFSTKYHDSETDLYYYGYRYYSPVLRTWLNRDPIEEDGGVNLYGLCENNPVAKIDRYGQDVYLITGNNSGQFLNDLIHQSVCVDVWDERCCKKTGKVCFSFGYSGVIKFSPFKTSWLGFPDYVLPGFLMHGIIYESDFVGRVGGQKGRHANRIGNGLRRCARKRDLKMCILP